VPGAAKLLGIEHDARTLEMCPACGVVTGRRGSKLRRDGTNRVGVSPGGLGWYCHACQAGGSAADLVSWHRFRRPVGRDRDHRRALGAYIDQLVGDAPAAPPRSAPAFVPLPAAEREARAKGAEARRWAQVCIDAADYVRDLLVRTSTTSEREAWHSLERFEPPPTPPETGAIVWSGERVTWGALHVAWRISVIELRERYFVDDG
jgi:hypothetical protein